MRKRRHAIAALVLAPLIAMAAASCLGRSVAPTSSSDQQCPLDGGVKIEQRPWAYSGDRPVCALCIKAGQGRFSFVEDGTDGCYTVTGLGTTNVTVTGGGTSRYCKDISNVVFYFGDCGGPPG
jgi:hypothetical protein